MATFFLSLFIALSQDIKTENMVILPKGSGENTEVVNNN